MILFILLNLLEILPGGNETGRRLLLFPTDRIDINVGRS